MHLRVERVRGPAHLDRLAHDAHAGADRHLREQRLDVLREQPYAAGGHAHADAVRVVGAVDQVRGQVEPHGVVAQRIVRAGRHHARQDLAAFRAVAADGFGGIPGRFLGLADDPVRTDRRVPVHLADADRVGDDFCPLARLRLGEVIEAVLGQVDDHALARPGGQHVARGQQHRRAVAGNPDVHARVRPLQLLVAHAVVARHVEQRVLVSGVHLRGHPDQVRAPGRQHEARRRRVRRRQQRCQHQQGRRAEGSRHPAQCVFPLICEQLQSAILT